MRAPPAFNRTFAPAKRLLPRSLLGRSLLIIVTPLILLQVISTIIFYDRHWDTVTRRLVGGFTGEVSTLIRLLNENPTPEGQAEIVELARTNLNLQITVKPGEVLAPDMPAITGDGILERTLVHQFDDRVRRPVVFDTQSYERLIEVNIQLPDAVLQIFVPRKRLFSSTTYIFVMWMVGSSLILFAVATLFMRNQVRPIRRLAIAADDFGKGRDHPEFRPAGATEVRQASAAFLDMRDRIQRQISQRTDMLSGVSHDLRTPLTRMRLQLALLPESEDVAALRSDIAEMEKMIDGYLAFARGEDAESAVEIDLGALLAEVAASARRNGEDVTLATDGPLHLTVRPTAMKRALTNLVENAARYGDRIRITARRDRKAVEITVEDDGPGIPDEQRDEVFRPFYRIERSRNPETGGVGLGLAIARDTVRRHGGEISLGESELGGLLATVRLPV